MINLQKFCATENDGREFLHAPMSDDKYTYATDGKIMLRVPKIDGYSAARSDIIKKMEILLAGPREDLIPFLTADDLPPTDNEVCELCGGVEDRNERSICEACDGNGEFDHGGYSYNCQSCNGAGYLNKNMEKLCCSCPGSGSKFPIVVRWGYTLIQSKYARLMAGLPDIRAENRDATGSMIDVIYFKFTGGDGMVIPCCFGYIYSKGQK